MIMIMLLLLTCIVCVTVIDIVVAYKMTKTEPKTTIVLSIHNYSMQGLFPRKDILEIIQMSLISIYSVT